MAGLLTEQSEGESQEAAHHPRGRQGWGCALALRAEASLRRKHGKPLEDGAFHSGLHVHSYFSIQLVHMWGTQALPPNTWAAEAPTPSVGAAQSGARARLGLLLQCLIPNALVLTALWLATSPIILAVAGEGPPQCQPRPVCDTGPKNPEGPKG